MDRDDSELDLLEDGLRKTMLSTSGAELDAALAELGWADMLSDMPDVAIPLVFRLLGETGSHASVLNDVVLQTRGRELGDDPGAALRRRRLGGVGLRRGDASTDARRAAAAPGGRRRSGTAGRCPPGASAGGWSARHGRC